MLLAPSHAQAHFGLAHVEALQCAGRITLTIAWESKEVCFGLCPACSGHGLQKPRKFGVSRFETLELQGFVCPTDGGR